MRKRLMRWEIAGFLFVSAVGTLLHFAYHWSGQSVIAAAFAAVNESTWEHMKILFVPYFVFTMVQFTAFAEPFRSFFACKAMGVLAGLVTIPLLFYTITGAIGPMPDWVNIGIFVLSAAVTYLTSYCLLVGGALRSGWQQVAGFAVFWILLFLFVYFTYRTPQLPIFRDPITGGYGIGH